jgi:hypothetical protein
MLDRYERLFENSTAHDEGALSAPVACWFLAREQALRRWPVVSNRHRAARAKLPLGACRAVSHEDLALFLGVEGK